MTPSASQDPWVKASVASGDSDFSESDTGSKIGWTVHTIDAVNADFPSMILIGGYPVISYTVSSKLKFAQANIQAPDSTDDWATHVVDPSGYTDTQSSIIELDGKPAIAHQDDETVPHDLMFSRSTVASPTSSSDWVNMVACSLGNSGTFCSAAVIDGKPAITHSRTDTAEILNTAATVNDPTLPSHWLTHDIDTDSSPQRGSSITILDGKPAIAHGTNGGVYDLRFAWATTVSPSSSSDWLTMTADPTSFTSGIGNHIALIDGIPMIAYEYQGNPINYSVKLAYANSAAPAGSGDWSHYTIDSTMVTMIRTGTINLVEWNGTAALTYHNGDNDSIYFAYSGEKSAVVSSNTGYNSMVILGNMPAVCYCDGTGLKFAVAE